MPEGRAPEAWQDENPVVGTDDQDILITVPDALSRSAETPLDGRKEGEDEKSAKNKAQKKKVQSGHCDKEETGEESESNGVYQWLDYFNWEPTAFLSPALQFLLSPTTKPPIWRKNNCGSWGEA